MTKPQRDLLLRLWSAACRNQGWDKAHGLNSKMVDALRKAETAKVFGGEKSWTKIEWRVEFGRIKNHLLFLGGNVQGTMETDRPDLDEKRRLLKYIHDDLMKCLGLYRPPERYVQDVLRDGGPGRKIYSGITSIDDLSAAPRPPKEGSDQPRASQLQCLIFTLSARINTLRNEAGETIHAMRMRAGVPCVCAQCTKGRAREEVAAELLAEGGVELEAESQAEETQPEALEAGGNPF